MVERFIEKYCEFGKNYSFRIKIMYEAFTDYCRLVKQPHISRKCFEWDVMNQFDVQKEKGKWNEMVFVGVRMRLDTPIGKHEDEFYLHHDKWMDGYNRKGGRSKGNEFG